MCFAVSAAANGKHGVDGGQPRMRTFDILPRNCALHFGGVNGIGKQGGASQKGQLIPEAAETACGPDAGRPLHWEAQRHTAVQDDCVASRGS